MNIRVPKQMLVDSFVYKEYLGINKWKEPEYGEEQIIEFSRITRQAEYTESTQGKKLLYNAVIYCYAELTTPFLDFKEQSEVFFDGKRHVITKVIIHKEPLKNRLYSYKLEVV